MPSSNPRRSAKAQVFVADLDAPILDPGDAHHLGRVLRLRPQEPVVAADGRGHWRTCLFTDTPSDGPALAPVGDVAFEPAPDPPITIAFALTKGDKPEWVVQKLTEAGVDVIVPFFAARSVVKWEADKAARNHERLVKVAREAAMQSRRAWLPEVRPATTFAAAVAESDNPALADPDGEPLSPGRTCLFLGPEGGWSGEELEAVAAKVSLAPNVLRAETATLAGGLLLAALRGGFVRFHDE